MCELCAVETLPRGAGVSTMGYELEQQQRAPRREQLVDVGVLGQPLRPVLVHALEVTQLLAHRQHLRNDHELVTRVAGQKVKSAMERTRSSDSNIGRTTKS